MALVKIILGQGEIRIELYERPSDADLSSADAHLQSRRFFRDKSDMSVPITWSRHAILGEISMEEDILSAISGMELLNGATIHMEPDSDGPWLTSTEGWRVDEDM